jgi:hypothetical protein
MCDIVPSDTNKKIEITISIPIPKKKKIIRLKLKKKTNIIVNPNPNPSSMNSSAIPENFIPIINNGTGAGGSNTNYFGKKFEQKTNNHSRLIESGFSQTNFSKKPNDFYLSKTFQDKTVIFLLQSGLKKYMKIQYNIELFRYPDEAYIILYHSGRKVLKILEKKEQNVEGSVETKLWSGPGLKREYELMLENQFEISYGFCVSEFLKNKFVSNDKKYQILLTILAEHNISVLYGDDANYFETLDYWIHQ